MADGMTDNDLVFALDAGCGTRIKVWVYGPPENYRVIVADPDNNAYVGMDKCDWERIVGRVKGQFE